MTPLVLASASGQEDLAIFLLDKGANPNARDTLGATALHYSRDQGDHGAQRGTLRQLCFLSLPAEHDQAGQGAARA
jgi:ankyrin repeat protein